LAAAAALKRAKKYNGTRPLSLPQTQLASGSGHAAGALPHGPIPHRPNTVVQLLRSGVIAPCTLPKSGKTTMATSTDDPSDRDTMSRESAPPMAGASAGADSGQAGPSSTTPDHRSQASAPGRQLRPARRASFARPPAPATRPKTFFFLNGYQILSFLSIGDAGAAALSEALKSNATLTELE
jgi:hypothetical protein